MENVKALIRAGQVLRVDETTLLPIERVVIRASRGNAGLRFTAWKEPFAIVVDNGRGLQVFDRAAQPVAVDTIRQHVPDLDDLLGKTVR